MKLQSIAKEAAACRAAWAAMPDATAGAHIHDEVPAEYLTEPIENRIAYILNTKPRKEQALRLRLMRPVTAPAWAEYEKVTASAQAEYEKVTASAQAEYKKVRAPALAEYEKVTASAQAEYKKVRAPAWAEYEKVTASAQAEYKKVRAPAWAEYKKVTASVHQAICPTPDCPWDGRSIFGGRNAR